MESITLFDFKKETEGKQLFRLESVTPTDTLRVCLKFNKMYVEFTYKYIALKNGLNEEVHICGINKVYKSFTDAAIVYYLCCSYGEKTKRYALIPIG